MRNLLLCGAALALAFSAQAQRVTTQALAVPADSPISTWATAIESVFQHVDRSQVPSGILQEFAFSNIDPDPYDGQALTGDNAADLSRWRRVYGGLYRARFGPNAPTLPSSVQVNAALQPYAADDIVDLPVLHLRYHRYRPDAVQQNLVQVHNNQIYDVAGRPASPYEARTAFVVAPERNSPPTCCGSRSARTCTSATPGSSPAPCKSTSATGAATWPRPGIRPWT